MNKVKDFFTYEIECFSNSCIPHDTQYCNAPFSHYNYCTGGGATLVALRRHLKVNNRRRISAYLVVFVLLGLNAFNFPACFDDVIDSTQDIYSINSQVLDAENSGDLETILLTNSDFSPCKSVPFLRRANSRRSSIRWFGEGHDDFFPAPAIFSRNFDVFPPRVNEIYSQSLNNIPHILIQQIKTVVLIS